MKTNKFLRILCIILECSFVGTVFLYIYNYYIANRKYEIIPASLRTRLNIFIIIAIISLVLFLVIRYILYRRNRKTVDKDVQLQMDFDEKKEEVYRNLEEPIRERVFIYKNEYEVPKNRQTICPNCGSVIDKNAFICVKCGFLVKQIVQQKVVERVIEKPVEKVVEKIVEKPVEKVVERIIERRPEKIIINRTKKKKKNSIINKAKLINILINLGLIIAIIIVLILIINLAIQRGIIV